MIEHNNGIVISTRNDIPWELIAIQEVDTRNEARWIEKQMKKSRGIREKWLAEYAYPPACKTYVLEAGSESKVSD